MESTPLSINGWLDKQNVVYTDFEIVFSLKKKGNSDLSFSMDEPWVHYVECDKPFSKRQIP